MELGLKDKIAIVPASSKGLGKAVALGLALEGAKVVICSRNEHEIKAAAKAINKQAKSDVLPIKADVSNQSDLEIIVNKTIDAFSTVHILINNAGGPPFGYFNDFDMQQWQKAIELNLFSTIKLTMLVTPFMKKQSWGRIINITSIAVKQPLDGLILSNTSRAGVIGFAKTISNELGKYNILVNSMCPGWVKTEMGGSGATRELPEGADTVVWLAALPDHGPRGKFFRDREVFEW